MVTEVIPHPDYNKSLKYNDIALLRLSGPVEFTKEIRPACLHQGQESISVNRSIATGWGRTDYGNHVIYYKYMLHSATNL